MLHIQSQFGNLNEARCQENGIITLRDQYNASGILQLHCLPHFQGIQKLQKPLP